MTIDYTDATGKTGALTLPVTLKAGSTPPVSPLPQPEGFATLAQHDYFSGDALSGLWMPNIGDAILVNGTLEDRPWRKTVPAPRSAIDAGGNNVEFYDPGQVKVADDMVTLTAVPDTSQPGYSWRSGCIRTGYVIPAGKPCVVQYRQKGPPGVDGQFPAAWQLGIASAGECDHAEGGNLLPGVTPQGRITSCNLHTVGNSQRVFDAGVDLSEDFHNWRVTITPGTSIVVEIDEGAIPGATYTANLPTGPWEFICNLQIAGANAAAWHTVASEATPNPSMLQMSAFEVWTP